MDRHLVDASDACGSPSRCAAAKRNYCICWRSPSGCAATAHECVCHRLSHLDGPKMCHGAEHDCVCPSKCAATAHEYVCRRLSHLDGPKMCHGAEHYCVCPSKCAATAHDCICDEALADTKACPSDEHVCVCAEGGTELCRRGGPAREHECVCDLGRWRTCRRWGAHGDGDGLVEAGAIRALVVVNYGAAETAPGADDVLRGFAALPYQLKLEVLEAPRILLVAAD